MQSRIGDFRQWLNFVVRPCLASLLGNVSISVRLGLQDDMENVQWIKLL